MIRQQEEEIPQGFSTRLSKFLLIFGFPCRGGETTYSRAGIETCQLGQWLITVDEVNQCNEAGCTNVRVDPVVALLHSISATLYEIVPISPTNPATIDNLRNVWLHFDENGTKTVIFR